MPPIFFESEVIGKKDLGQATYLIELKGKLDFEPGQFAMISLPDDTTSILPRPFSIFDASNGGFSVVFKIFGSWTKNFSQLPIGKKVNVLAPCGTGFLSAMRRYEIKNPHKILGIAGGLGIASIIPPMAYLSGEKTLIFGGRSREDIILKDKIRQLGLSLHIATQDGSEGEKGLVTDIIRNGKVLPDEFDVALACGPTPMLHALISLWKEMRVSTPLLLAMEERMGCGIGICFSCAIRTKEGMKLCCKYGPVFLHSEILI